MKRLTKQVLKIIKTNPKLFCEIADLLGLAPITLTDLLSANTDERLVSEEVLQKIREYLIRMQDMPLTENLQAA